MVLRFFSLATCSIGSDRGGELGTSTQGWKQALKVMTMTYPGRINIDQK